MIHGLVISGVVLFGQTHRKPAGVTIDDLPTLELVAAPANAPEQLAETAVVPGPPAPIPPVPGPLPLEEIVPAGTVEPILVATVPPPQPLLPTEQRPVAAPVAAVPVAVAHATTRTDGGDSSSPVPGKDFTSVAGKPNTLARADYLKNPEPEYPLIARRRGQQGTVLLNLTVSASGRPTEISLKRSSGYQLLDQAALKAVRNWEFEPARIGDVSVESKIEVPVCFKLTN